MSGPDHLPTPSDTYRKHSVMPPTRDGDKIKLGVLPHVLEEPKPVPYLGEFYLEDSLTQLVMNVSGHWNLKHPELYAFRYSEAPEEYVTESNRSRLQNGTKLHLVHSIRKMTEDILKKINHPDNRVRKEAVEELTQWSHDISFAMEFINQQGMHHLLTCLKNMTNRASTLLPPILSFFLDLMDHGIMSWDDIHLPFIKQVTSYVTCQETVDAKTLSTSLIILENVVLNSPSRIPSVERQITIPKLLNHIKCSDPQTQQAVLALINALIQKSEPHVKERYCSTLTTCQNLAMIFDNVVLQHVQNTSQGRSDLAHQLYILQQLILNQHEECINTSMDVNGQIRELQRIASESDGEVPSGITLHRPELKEVNKKLGFENDTNPAEDFKETLPGMLALDNMVYFAHKHSDQFLKLVLENYYQADSHKYAFGRASIEVTKLLYEILKIGEMPNDHSQSYHAMLFSCTNAFQELFSICIVLFNKTWKEMKAKMEDFSKVVSVVKEKIKQSISEQPPTLQVFLNTANNKTYAEVAEIWHKERLDNEMQEMQAPPIQELRNALQPDILELIQQHRLRILEEGTKFWIPRGVRTKHKFRYCRLSPNHKVLYYDECDEKSVPSLDELTKTINIKEIESIVTGEDCPHMKEKAWKKSPSNLAFSLLKDGAGGENSNIDFVAPDETTFNYWVDGLNALLCQTMPSPQATADLKMLLDMELKLRLLDVERITIPQTQPEIPPPPPNFNFHYLQE